MSAWSGQVRVDIQLISWNVFCYSPLRRLPGSNLLTFFLTYLLTFFLTYHFTFFLTYLLTFFLTSFWHIFWHSFWQIVWHSFWHIFWQFSDISFDMLSDISSDILSDISKPKPNIHSFTKKPLCKLYIYLTPRSKSTIHNNFVPVNVIALSASDRPAKRQLSPKMQNACSSTHTHTPHASDRPAKQQLSPNMQKGLRCHDYISWRVQTMKPDACHCGSFTSSV